MKILKKKYVFFFRLFFSLQILQKSQLNSIGKGAEFPPLRTTKNPLGVDFFYPILFIIDDSGFPTIALPTIGKHFKAELKK